MKVPPRACYSMSTLYHAADMVKAMNWTVKHKEEHYSKYNEILAIYEYAEANINAIAFDPDIEISDYGKAAFNYKAYTKKELDTMLRHTYDRLCTDLNDIKTLIASGEVDCID